MNRVLFLVFLCVQFIRQSQDFLVFGNIAHAVPVMNKARDSRLVDQHLGRHPSQFEQVDLLPIEFEYASGWVRQANKGQGFLLPVGGKGFGIFRANDHNFHIAGDKLLIVLAQLRHVRAAEWSGKGAVENQQHIFLSVKICQVDGFA